MKPDLTTPKVCPTCKREWPLGFMAIRVAECARIDWCTECGTLREVHWDGTISLCVPERVKEGKS
jgi:hypothetical protein